jgi:hypothetical protein
MRRSEADEMHRVVAFACARDADRRVAGSPQPRAWFTMFAGPRGSDMGDEMECRGTI